MDFRRSTRDASRSHIGERAHDVLVRAGSCRRQDRTKPHEIERDKPAQGFCFFWSFSFKKKRTIIIGADIKSALKALRP